MSFVLLLYSNIELLGPYSVNIPRYIHKGHYLLDIFYIFLNTLYLPYDVLNSALFSFSGSVNYIFAILDGLTLNKV